ncbi:MAG: YicC/YloC family endoribonuclease [Nitrospirota bacterium]
MIKSMTGFGKGEGGGFVVEMRSVNHKFLDIAPRLPKSLSPLEARLKKAVGERFSRGRIDVFVTSGGSEEGPKALKLDIQAAKQYIGLLSELKSQFGLSGEVDLNMVGSLKDIIIFQEETGDLEAVWSSLEAPLKEAMNALERMRAEEGVNLDADIRSRALSISLGLDEVAKRSPEVVKEYQAKLKDRVEKLAQGVELDGDRLAQEAALMADRCDITEEIVRGKSHLAQLHKMLDEGGPVGRKMDFLIQEINRELNTIGSKASDFEIARRVIEMKSEMEKIREQVQNIE